jgi:hypothetical protein
VELESANGELTRDDFYNVIGTYNNLEDFEKVPHVAIYGSFKNNGFLKNRRLVYGFNSHYSL